MTTTKIKDIAYDFAFGTFLTDWDTEIKPQVILDEMRDEVRDSYELTEDYADWYEPHLAERIESIAVNIEGLLRHHLEQFAKGEIYE